MTSSLLRRCKSIMTLKFKPTIVNTIRSIWGLATQWLNYSSTACTETTIVTLKTLLSHSFLHFVSIVGLGREFISVFNDAAPLLLKYVILCEYLVILNLTIRQVFHALMDPCYRREGIKKITLPFVWNLRPPIMPCICQRFPMP